MIIAIQLAETKVSSDFDKNKKDSEKLTKEAISEAGKETVKESLAHANEITAMLHASDALEIGRMYWILKDNKNATKWLNYSKSWNPYTARSAENMLLKIRGE